MGKTKHKVAKTAQSSIQDLTEQLAAALVEEEEKRDEMVAMLVRCLEDVVELDLCTATLAEKRKADPIFAAARAAIAKVKGGE